ncbi:transmembrane protein 65 isoform X3 [Leptopilina boulardi]|uniref:transmembrane protein 65 isoform X3 n=1 Tax=Leptopilina boulardi TaxID=63433 RepID=UPI0021F5ACDF|nr:transmembrane protein 65 isoform X3 [Leptopilina boulardi]
MCSSAVVYHAISKPNPLINQIGRIRLLQPGCQQNRYSWGSLTVNLNGGYSYRTLTNGKINNKNNASSSQIHQEKTISSAESLILNRDTVGVLKKPQVKDFAIKLTSEERELLIKTLQECQSMKIKAEFEAESSKNNDVSFETVPQPCNRDLLRVLVANAIPFIGFGFLDNFIMIIAGDRIEMYLGTVITLSTMAAAAIGNTFSDILGIGSAYYVELIAQKIGFKPPKLTPIQLDLPKSRMAANMGRVIGVTLGCILGMIPLIFLHHDEKTVESETTKTSEKEKAPVLSEKTN